MNEETDDFPASFEIEKAAREEEYEFEKMTTKNESVNGYSEHSKEYELGGNIEIWQNVWAEKD